MTITKELGKIKKAEFGCAHEPDFLFGLKLSFGGEDWVVSDGLKYTINMSPDCKWENTQKHTERIMKFVYNLLKEAQVENVSQLIGIPVEVTFDGEGFGRIYKKFRVLKEVI